MARIQFRQTSMHKVTRYGVFIVVGHLIVLSLHAMAHVQLAVYASWLGNVFIVLVIWLAPLVAMFLLLQQRLRAGVVLLGGAMLGSLLFGVYHHFVALSPDHVSHVPAGKARALFQVTAVLLAVFETFGCGYALWSWRGLQKAEYA